MLFETPTQWAILALVLILGWVLGLLSRSGGGRYKRELAVERRSWVEERKAYETRINASNARIAELERAVPATAATGGIAGSIRAAARGGRDDLSLLHGVGHDGENRLNDAGYHSYRDIEKMNASDEAALEGRLGLAPGTIERENWREQAALLRAGKHDEHRDRFVR